MTHPNSTQAHHEHESTGKGRSYRKRIVALYSLINQPMTDREIIDLLQATDVNNVRPEITRLKQAGVLREVGKVKCPVTEHTVRTCCMNEI